MEDPARRRHAELLAADGRGDHRAELPRGRPHDVQVDLTSTVERAKLIADNVGEWAIHGVKLLYDASQIPTHPEPGRSRGSPARLRITRGSGFSWSSSSRRTLSGSTSRSPTTAETCPALHRLSPRS